jgi:uncharacterized protein
VIVPDINLLLYAYDAESPSHHAAKAWWKACLSGQEQVGLAPPVIFGFIRVGTSTRAFRKPMNVTEALNHVRSWLHQPAVQILDSGHDHIEAVLKMLESVGAAGNLVTDAQIAALSIEYDAVVHTTDADFIRFPKLRWFNPITEAGSRAVRKRRK